MLRGKVCFFIQAQSCPSLWRTLPVTLLRQTAAYKYFQNFVKSCLQSLCVCNSLRLTAVVGNVQQRSTTYVWKCKRTCYVVEVEMNVNIPPHPSPPPQKFTHGLLLALTPKTRTVHCGIWSAGAHGAVPCDEALATDCSPHGKHKQIPPWLFCNQWQ